METSIPHDCCGPWGMYILSPLTTSPFSIKSGSHVNLQGQIFALDCGADIYSMLDLSGEPLAPEVQLVRGNGPQKTAKEIAAINVAKREYQKAYMDYWNSTATITGTGRPVDCFVTAVAPWAAVMPSKYTYLTYSTFVNVLDYSSAVIRVTTADKDVDVVPSDYTPLSDADRVVYDNCKYSPSPAACQTFP